MKTIWKFLKGVIIDPAFLLIGTDLTQRKAQTLREALLLTALKQQNPKHSSASDGQTEFGTSIELRSQP